MVQKKTLLLYEVINGKNLCGIKETSDKLTLTDSEKDDVRPVVLGEIMQLSQPMAIAYLGMSANEKREFCSKFK